MATACMGYVAYCALKVTGSIGRALEDEETTVVLGIGTANGISEAWSGIKNEVYHDYGLVGFLLNPALLGDRINMEGLAVTYLHDAAERVLHRLYFDAGDVDALICQFHASLTEFEQRRGSFFAQVHLIRPAAHGGQHRQVAPEV